MFCYCCNNGPTISVRHLWLLVSASVLDCTCSHNMMNQKQTASFNQCPSYLQLHNNVCHYANIRSVTGCVQTHTIKLIKRSGHDSFDLIKKNSFAQSETECLPSGCSWEILFYGASNFPFIQYKPGSSIYVLSILNHFSISLAFSKMLHSWYPIRNCLNYLQNK